LEQGSFCAKPLALESQAAKSTASEYIVENNYTQNPAQRSMSDLAIFKQLSTIRRNRKFRDKWNAHDASNGPACFSTD
jgi:hypothetical protein